MIHDLYDLWIRWMISVQEFLKYLHDIPKASTGTVEEVAAQKKKPQESKWSTGTMIELHWVQMIPAPIATKLYDW